VSRSTVGVRLPNHFRDQLVGKTAKELRDSDFTFSDKVLNEAVLITGLETRWINAVFHYEEPKEECVGRLKPDGTCGACGQQVVPVEEVKKASRGRERREIGECESCEKPTLPGEVTVEFHNTKLCMECWTWIRESMHAHADRLLLAIKRIREKRKELALDSERGTEVE